MVVFCRGGTADTSARDPVGCVASFVEGNARKWLISNWVPAASRRPASWHDFRTVLKEAFFEHHSDEISCVRLFSMKQDGPLEEYISKIMGACLSARGVDDLARTLLFIEGLLHTFRIRNGSSCVDKAGVFIVGSQAILRQIVLYRVIEPDAGRQRCQNHSCQTRSPQTSTTSDDRSTVAGGNWCAPVFKGGSKGHGELVTSCTSSVKRQRNKRTN